MTRKPKCSKPRAKSARALVDAGIRVHMDEREGSSPGFKFNDWEMRGVPLRIEIGPKDVAKGTVVLARRDRPGKEGKSFVPQEGLAAVVATTLVEIQKALLDRARAFRDANTKEPKDLRRVQDRRRNWICLRVLVRRKTSARPRSRKKPRPRSAAFPSTNPRAQAPAFCAPNPRPRRASSPAPTRSRQAL